VDRKSTEKGGRKKRVKKGKARCGTRGMNF
jgi:hypothetical protein